MSAFRPSYLRRALVALLRPWLWSWRGLEIGELDLDPFAEFAKWFELAKRCFWLEFPEAMCLSTVSAAGEPEGRMVLLKDFDRRGFVFYTNFESAKGRALSANPQAALTFFWEPLQRQVRVQGQVEQVSTEEADQYFASRARLSQIGAWASRQSSRMSARSELDQRVREIEQRYSGKSIPRPPHWSGYRVLPSRIEFWKLRFNRLHDRFLYTRGAHGDWERSRLYP